MQPLLANDIWEMIVPVIFVLLGFVGWIVNLIQQNTKAKPQREHPRPRPQQQQNRRQSEVAEEINVFVSETQANRKPDRKRQPPPPPRPQPPKKAPRRVATEIPSDSFGSTPSSGSGQMSRRPGGEISSRAAPAAKNLGQQVVQHVQDLQTHVAQDVRHLQSNVAAGVSQHLGTFSGQAAAPVAAMSNSESIASSLRDPQSVKRAFVFSLILSPPRGMRGQNPGLHPTDRRSAGDS